MAHNHEVARHGPPREHERRRASYTLELEQETQSATLAHNLDFQITLSLIQSWPASGAGAGVRVHAHISQFDMCAYP